MNGMNSVLPGDMKTHTPIAESPPGPVMRIDGREYLYFVGTSYLGLQAHPEVIRAACEAAERYGIHSATSRAGFGNTPPTLSVERRAAEFFGSEASFYFPAGYAGNSILLRGVESGFDAVFLDEHSHYCVFEAASQSGRPTFRFRHRDAGDLADNLHKHLLPGQRPLVMTDGVFAVRGTIAPLADYCTALANYAGAGLLVDDAHGVGVLGHRGRGTLEHFGMFDGSINADIVSPLSRPTFGRCPERARARAVDAEEGEVSCFDGSLERRLRIGDTLIANRGSGKC